MASWISSKLKVAESLLEHIDHQAAESLGKQDKGDLPLGHMNVDKKINNFDNVADPRFRQTSQNEANSKKHSQALQLHGLRKSLPNTVSKEPANHGSQKTSSRVSEPVPIIEKNDWTELLASNELPGIKNALGNTETTESSGIGGRPPTSDRKRTSVSVISSRKSSSLASKSAVSSANQSALSKKVHPTGASSSLASKRKNKEQLKSNQVSKSDDSSEETPRKFGSIELVVDDISPTILDGPGRLETTWGKRPSEDRRCLEVDKIAEKIDERVHGSVKEVHPVGEINDILASGRDNSFQAVSKGSSMRPQTRPDLQTATAISKAIHDNMDLCTMPPLNKFNSYVDIAEATKQHCLPSVEDDSTEKATDLSTTNELYRIQELESSNAIFFGSTNIERKNSENDTSVKDNTKNNNHMQDQSELKSNRKQKQQTRHSSGMRFKSIVVDGGLSESDEKSETDTDSTSGSESEDEIDLQELQRKRKEEEMAAEAASIEVGKAVIRDREDLVNRLQMEKTRLEQMLADYEEQQKQEAIELEKNMKEALHAMDLEKQKHYKTRMEALERIAKLEKENVELAKTLARVQRNLDLEVANAIDIRDEIELKVVSQADIERKLTQLQKQLALSEEHENSNDYEDGEDSFEKEHLQIDQRIGLLQIKVKEMEDMFERTTEAWDGQTDVEVELERRLSQFTDYLLQKQAQVEALSAEKAILVLKMETLSEEINKENVHSQGNKASGFLDPFYLQHDLEAGLSSSTRVKDLKGYTNFGFHSILLLVRQLDTVFSTGAYYLRRHASAQWFAFVYLVALHLWVLFILFKSEESIKSSTVFSLDH